MTGVELPSPTPGSSRLTSVQERAIYNWIRRPSSQFLARVSTAWARPSTRPYDACEKQAGRVSSLSLVRYRGTDYSVPTAYDHREVVVRGYVHEVVISCGANIIARHVRSYEREDFVFDPLHYLALLERKIRALDQAAPLAGWQLPEAFATLRRLLEARMGKREFVQVLRLMEVFRIDDVAVGVRDAIDRGVIGFDAILLTLVAPNGRCILVPSSD